MFYESNRIVIISDTIWATTSISNYILSHDGGPH